MTTNKAFKDWNTVFPNATCIAALLDRLTHHADITLIEGTSYRVRESELEAAAHKKTSSERKPHAQLIVKLIAKRWSSSISACPIRRAA